MEVYVDGVKESWTSEMSGTLLEIVAVLSSRLREGHRALLAVQIDGEIITPDDLRAAAGGRTVDTIQRIEIQSEPVGRLVDQSLGELDEHLPMLPQVCHKLSAVFQSETPEDGYAPFNQLAEIWHAVKVREMQLANALDIRMDDLTIGGRTLMQLTDELNDYLREAEEAMRAGDSVALGDLLAYELAPRAELETKIVGLLRSHIPHVS